MSPTQFGQRTAKVSIFASFDVIICIHRAAYPPLASLPNPGAVVADAAEAHRRPFMM